MSEENKTTDHTASSSHYHRCCTKIRKSSVYTKTGDEGYTSLFDGSRASKSNILFQILGELDALNAQIGLSAEYAFQEDVPNQSKIVSCLHYIQVILFEIGAIVANPNAAANDPAKANIFYDDTEVLLLENIIDRYDNDTPSLANFILPGGGLTACTLHLARTTCRTCERHIVDCYQNAQKQQQQQSIHNYPNEYYDIYLKRVLKYINRLSDFLFVLARHVTHKLNKNEVIYKKSETKLKRDNIQKEYSL